MAKKPRPQNLEQLNPAETELDPNEWLEAFERRGKRKPKPKPGADEPKAPTCMTRVNRASRFLAKSKIKNYMGTICVFPRQSDSLSTTYAKFEGQLPAKRTSWSLSCSRLAHNNEMCAHSGDRDGARKRDRTREPRRRDRGLRGGALTKWQRTRLQRLNFRLLYVSVAANGWWPLSGMAIAITAWSPHTGV
jgi:hypothetical protein